MRTSLHSTAESTGVEMAFLTSLGVCVLSNFFQRIKDGWKQSDRTRLKVIVVVGTMILTYISLNAELWILAYSLGAVHLVVCALLFTSVLLNFVSVYLALTVASSISVLAMVLSLGWIYDIHLTMQAHLAAKTAGSAFGSIIFGLALRLWLAIKNA